MLSEEEGRKNVILSLRRTLSRLRWCYYRKLLRRDKVLRELRTTNDRNDAGNR